MGKIKFSKKIKEKKELKDSYKIMIVDDEVDVHKVTISLLKDFIFEERGIEFISAYSAKEAKSLIKSNPDTALILLDVVMEEDDSGLKVAKYIREELKNRFVRIILRTGQAGQVPEEEVIVKYDINDYKEKTELTSTKLFTLLYSSLRAYRDIMKLEELNKEQSELLIQQSKMAEVGEMIGAIAHQWKQPLNTLALTIQDIEDAYNYNELNAEYIKEIVDSSMGQIEFMSQTIDVFKNFFKPNRERKTFSVREEIKEVYKMLSYQLKAHNIKVGISENDFLANGYPNEFKQVILNILNNSKDAIIQRQKEQKGLIGEIKIDIEKRDKLNKIIFLDNGGGVKENIINKIFEPYFTTKEKEGTGVGLYMSKIIIERNMNGKISVKNLNKGLEFTVELPLS